MTNPDPSMSCCSNQPAFGSTLLCVSGEWGGAWLVGWGCVRVCEEGGLGYWGVCLRVCGEEVGGVDSVCAKARLMLCVATEYK